MEFVKIYGWMCVCAIAIATTTGTVTTTSTSTTTDRLMSLFATKCSYERTVAIMEMLWLQLSVTLQMCAWKYVCTLGCLTFMDPIVVKSYSPSNTNKLKWSMLQNLNVNKKYSDLHPKYGIFMDRNIDCWHTKMCMYLNAIKKCLRFIMLCI